MFTLYQYSLYVLSTLIFSLNCDIQHGQHSETWGCLWAVLFDGQSLECQICRSHLGFMISMQVQCMVRLVWKTNYLVLPSILPSVLPSVLLPSVLLPSVLSYLLWCLQWYGHHRKVQKANWMYQFPRTPQTASKSWGWLPPPEGGATHFSAQV